MDNEKLDTMLKNYFSKTIDLPEKASACPSVDILSKYVSGELEAAMLHDVSGHVKGCKFCNELIEGALLYSAYAKNINVGAVPDKVKNRAKSLNPVFKTKEHRIMHFLKRNIWIILSLASLTMSFFVSRYFFQFLILAVIFGLKWVFNRESVRTIVTIYNAWKRHDKESDKELDEIFKDRL
jgi:hypothetical protein